jgi:hypothetical protein
MRKYKTPLAILKAARRLLTPKHRWTKGVYSDEREGETCYCSLGALMAVSSNRYTLGYDVAAYELHKISLKYPKGRRGIIAYNDHPQTTHRQVLSLFDRAIKSLEKQR